MENVVTRTCETCGAVFVPHRANQKRCNKPGCPSYKIAEAQRRSYYRQQGKLIVGDKPLQTCALCGKQFVVGKTLQEKYCSGECRRIRMNYSTYVAYSKKNGVEPKNLKDYVRKALPLGHPVRKALGVNEDLCTIAETIKRNKEYLNRNKETRMQQIVRPVYNNNINNPRYARHRYTPEELDEKLNAKTKRIIDTINTLQKADIDETVIFEAVKSITRMPLNNF